MIGPVLVIFFKDVEFFIGGLYFNHLNAVGLLVAGLLLVALILANLLVHDCSKMFDLKRYIDEMNAVQYVEVMGDENNNNKSNNNNTSNNNDNNNNNNNNNNKYNNDDELYFS